MNSTTFGKSTISKLLIDACQAQKYENLKLDNAARSMVSITFGSDSKKLLSFGVKNADKGTIVTIYRYSCPVETILAITHHAKLQVPEVQFHIE